MKKKKRPIKKDINQNNLDWEPISYLPEMTILIDNTIKEAKEHEQFLINISTQPDKFDAPSINMIKSLNLELLEIAQSYLEQGEYWKSEVRTMEEHFDLTLFFIQCRKLIDQLSNSNLVLIEKMCAIANTNIDPDDLKDAELGLQFLLGKIHQPRKR